MTLTFKPVKETPMEIASVGSFAALLEVVDACMKDAEGGKHAAYHLVMEFHKRGVDLSVREPRGIHEASSDLQHG